MSFGCLRNAHRAIKSMACAINDLPTHYGTPSSIPNETTTAFSPTDLQSPMPWVKKKSFEIQRASPGAGGEVWESDLAAPTGAATGRLPPTGRAGVRPPRGRCDATLCAALGGASTWVMWWVGQVFVCMASSEEKTKTAHVRGNIDYFEENFFCMCMKDNNKKELGVRIVAAYAGGHLFKDDRGVFLVEKPSGQARLAQKALTKQTKWRKQTTKAQWERKSYLCCWA